MARLGQVPGIFTKVVVGCAALRYRLDKNLSPWRYGFPMALTIVVRSGDSESPPTISFDAPRIVIGRGEGCEVRLPDPSVSHRHASIRQRGTEYIVVDEGSTNGTFVGPVRLSPQASRVIKHGDQLRVGRVWLEIRIEHVPASPDAGLATKEIALGLVASALKAQGQESDLKVSVVSGPDQGVELVLDRRKKRHLVGRGKEASLQLSDVDASRRHVELERRGDRIEVRDLGSKNGSLLDGERIPKGKRAIWKPGQILKLGGNELTYEDPVASALVELEAVEDELLDPLEPPEPPNHEAAATPQGSEPTRALPLDERPQRISKQSGRPTWLSADVLVAGFALVVLALSVVGLVWLFGGP